MSKCKLSDSNSLVCDFCFERLENADYLDPKDVAEFIAEHKACQEYKSFGVQPRKDAQ